MKKALTAATAISAILCALGPASAGQFNIKPTINPAIPRMAPIPMQRLDAGSMQRIDRNVGRRDSDANQQSASLPKKRTALPKQGIAGKLVNAKVIRDANQARDAAQVREAAEAMRIPVVTGGFGDDRFGDALNPGGSDAGAAGAATRAVARFQQIFGRGGSGLDWLDQLNGRLDGHSHNNSHWTAPGLVQDTGHLPGFSAGMGGTEPTDPSAPPAADKPNDSVSGWRANSDGSVSSSWSRENGMVEEKYVYDGGTTVGMHARQGDRYTSSVVVERHPGSTTVWVATPGGGDIETSRTTTPHGTETRSTVRDGNGAVMSTGSRWERSRTVDPDAMVGGSNCMPSGWGCSAPMTAGDIRAGGTVGGGDPGPDDDNTRAITPGPTINMSRSLVVNPNPDDYAGSGGSSGPAHNVCPDCQGDGRGEPR